MYWCLAPMDWITDTAYRQIVKEIFEKYNKNPNKKLLLFTEFVSSDWFVHNFDWVKHHLQYEKIEKPLICQIFWANKDNLLYTAKQIEKNYEFDWIDLNIGCPSPKIMKTWAWAALMKDKEKTLEIIKTLSDNLDIPFSIKTRIWLDNSDKSNQFKFLIKASNFCKIISIHARTYKQEHSGEVDIDFVLNLKKSVNPDCKVIFNWWINEGKLNDIDFMDKMSLLDWIMIWQAAIWNPWIFVDHKPDWEEKKQIIKKHLKLNIKYKWERRWVIEFRKFIGNYIKGIDNASKIRVQLMKVDNYEDFCKILDGI